MKRISLGLILIALGTLLLLNFPFNSDNAPSTYVAFIGFLFNMNQGEQANTWRLVLIAWLVLIGSILIVSVVPGKYLKICIGCLLFLYLLYMILLWITGRQLFLASWPLNDLVHTPFLVLTSMYCFALLRFLIDYKTRVDVYGIAIGAVTLFLVDTANDWPGPAVPNTSFISIFVQILAVPIFGLIVISFVCMILNICIGLWLELRIPSKA